MTATYGLSWYQYGLGGEASEHHRRTRRNIIIDSRADRADEHHVALVSLHRLRGLRRLSLGSSDSSITYAFASSCTVYTESEDLASGSQLCLMQPGGFTVTCSASFYEESTSAAEDQYYSSQRCGYEGTARASCTMNVASGDDGWTQQYTATLDAANVTLRAITVTAGLEKLAAETGSRSGSLTTAPPTGTPSGTITGTAASSTSSAGGDKAIGISVAGVADIALAAFAL
ncbi:uncharacterized protein BDZ99DRAFT_496078 [Mytilinidion resinicola]|uniref:Uncharacterized protein n=1 Tax=Mytilinidion resinicola TaxID=574789 RepID=A0A6A6YX37_9PEZI|nr:uncharacterized protein BDZ99DRAFT_496078 [Mytilinidion resinicola]KAF2812963.1 hypothetical protein BDZ99DRAFT_496078 [Mytilinidion resinicola]